jgi:ribosomal protein S18 acetylase RimI-like enzyme
MTQAYTIRYATVDDIPHILQQRNGMFTDMGVYDDFTPEQKQAIEVVFGEWLRQRIPTQEYIGWMVENEAGQVVAGAGLWILTWLPNIINHSGKRGYILNVYVNRDARRQGLARRLLNTALDECRARGIHQVRLHASNEGRPLYESLGFEAENEMSLYLENVGL